MSCHHRVNKQSSTQETFYGGRYSTSQEMDHSIIIINFMLHAALLQKTWSPSQMVTTNQRSVFVHLTNERPEKPVSASRSHQHQWPPCVCVAQSEARVTSLWPMEAALQITALQSSHNEQKGWRGDALLTSAPNEWNKTMNKTVKPESKCHNLSPNQPSHKHKPPPTTSKTHPCFLTSKQNSLLWKPRMHVPCPCLLCFHFNTMTNTMP